MKILFINTPFIRKNNKIFEISRTRRIVKYSKILGKRFQERVQKALFKNVEYGNRAGSRWPSTLPFECASYSFPFIMTWAAALLRQNGFQADVIDCIAAHDHSYKKLFRRIRKSKADIVVLETSTPTIDIDCYCAKHIAKYAKVAMAGPHITEDTIDDLIKKNPFVTYWLKGEYIKSSLTMAQTQRPGVYEIEFIDDLNKIPFPVRDYKGAELYFDGHCPTPWPLLFMTGSKGCPFSCSYCLWPNVMYKNRCNLRSPENIVAEIRENLEKYPYKSIYFDDDTWNIGTERISKLCDMLKEIGLPWSMMGRLDCSPDWLFDKMVECGCQGMRFGVESFNVETLKKINKKLERIDFRKTLEHLTEKYPNIHIHICMMKNLPGQTEQIHKQDMEIVKELGFMDNNEYRTYQLGSCTPFPGTPLYENLVKKYGKEKMSDWKMYNGMKDNIMSVLSDEK